MSFILDAIKKSENERRKQRQPDVHSLQGNAYTQPVAGQRRSRLLLLLVALFIMAGTGFWLWPRLSSEFVLVPRAVVDATAPQKQEAASPVTNVATQRQVDAAQQPHASVIAPDSNAELPPRHLIKEL